VIALCREEIGVLVMEFSAHLWPEDLDLAIPVVHEASRSRQNPLLLLVGISADFDTSPLAVLRQILQPGILAQNRRSRVAVLTTFTQESKPTTASQNNLEVQFASSAPTRDMRPRLGFWRSPRLIHYLQFSINSIRRDGFRSLFFGLFTRELTGHAFIRRAG